MAGHDDESLHEAIHERVVIVDYDSAWPIMFEQERDRLLALFPGQFLAIEHFGSTAVPGLAAKPVIDMLAGVVSMQQADSLLQPLCESAYTTSMKYNASIGDRRWLMRSRGGHRTHHLHLVVHGGMEWNLRLAFRDRLRAEPELAGRYLRLKRELAAKHGNDREAYTQAKNAFIRMHLQ